VLGHWVKCGCCLRLPAAGNDDADRRPEASRSPFRALVTPPAAEWDCRARAICGDVLYGRSTEHNTPQHEAQEIHYPWHPLYGREVFIQARRRRGGSEVFSCYVAGKRLQGCFELPAWMLDRAHCQQMRLQVDPEVDWESLVEVQQLLAIAARTVVKRSCPEEVVGQNGATSTYAHKKERTSSETSRTLRADLTPTRVGQTAPGGPNPGDGVIDRAAGQSGRPATAVARRDP